MWQNALIATVAVLFGFVFWVVSQIDFLIPYKHLLMRQYGVRMVVFVALLAVNLYAAFFLLTRRFFLKDTGRKLAHMHRQGAK